MAQKYRPPEQHIPRQLAALAAAGLGAVWQNYGEKWGKLFECTKASAGKTKISAFGGRDYCNWYFNAGLL